MRVLVTGGTGLVGTAVVHTLVAHGHDVRVLARDDSGEDRVSLGDVEFQRGDVGDALSIRGAATRCDAIVHLAGIVREGDGDQRFERINVEGTRNILGEGERAGVARLVYMSSLGADRGASAYHASKRAAEELVRGYDGNWTILRAGNVYGPGVGTIALFLRLVRTLPVVPAIGDPDIRFQPIWVGDLAEGVARCAERRDLHARVMELAGRETTSQRELFERFASLTARTPPLVTIPASIASLGARAMAVVHVPPPITEDQVTMYEEENVLADGKPNELIDELGVEPLALREGMELMAYATPEQLPSDGHGSVVRRRFWTDLTGTTCTPAEIIAIVQREFAELMPSGAVTVGPEQLSSCELKPGATITLALPIRGNVQIRVEDVTPTSIVCLTLLGHPLAGAVHFKAGAMEANDENSGAGVRFMVETIDRPSNFLDGLAMATVGVSLKRMTWTRMVQAVAARALRRGEDKDECQVQHDEARLDAHEVEEAEAWMRRLVGTRAATERLANNALDRSEDNRRASPA